MVVEYSVRTLELAGASSDPGEIPERLENKMRLKSVIGVGVLFAFAASMWAADDPRLGTWKINLEKVEATKPGQIEGNYDDHRGFTRRERAPIASLSTKHDETVPCKHLRICGPTMVRKGRVR